MDTNRLRLNQIRRLLRQAVLGNELTTPPSGWLRSIREALGISLRQQAKRIGVNPSTLLSHEKNEVTGNITLAQLRKLAAALDCEVRYTLVPRHDLEDTVLKQAETVARAEVLGVSHTMALEQQKPNNSFEQDMIAERKRELLSGNWSRLWR